MFEPTPCPFPPPVFEYGADKGCRLCDDSDRCISGPPAPLRPNSLPLRGEVSPAERAPPASGRVPGGGVWGPGEGAAVGGQRTGGAARAWCMVHGCARARARPDYNRHRHPAIDFIHLCRASLRRRIVARRGPDQRRHLAPRPPSRAPLSCTCRASSRLCRRPDAIHRFTADPWPPLPVALSKPPLAGRLYGPSVLAVICAFSGVDSSELR